MTRRSARSLIVAAAVCAAILLLVWIPDNLPATERIDRYNEQDHEAVLGALRAPDHSYTFRRSEIVGEFHIQLLNRRVLPADPDPEYMVLQWDRRSHWLTLWLEKRGEAWVVVEGVRWRKDVVF